MTKNKDKPNKDFSHVETAAFRATFIDNIEKAKELGKKLEASTSIRIKINDYLGINDPILKDCEIALQDFVPVLDDAKDQVLYIKIKPEDKTIIYHLTAHPDTLKALREISLEAKSKGFAMVDSKVHIQQAADMLRKKLSGTLKMKVLFIKDIDVKYSWKIIDVLTHLNKNGIMSLEHVQTENYVKKIYITETIQKFILKRLIRNEKEKLLLRNG